MFLQWVTGSGEPDYEHGYKSWPVVYRPARLPGFFVFLVYDPYTSGAPPDFLFWLPVSRGNADVVMPERIYR